MYARGQPKPKVEWLRDGVVLEESQYIRFVVDGYRYMLELKNLKKDQSGKIKARVTNTHGTTECEADLVVGESSSVTVYVK